MWHLELKCTWLSASTHNVCWENYITIRERREAFCFSSYVSVTTKFACTHSACLMNFKGYVHCTENNMVLTMSVKWLGCFSYHTF